MRVIHKEIKQIIENKKKTHKECITAAKRFLNDMLKSQNTVTKALHTK